MFFTRLVLWHADRNTFYHLIAYRLLGIIWGMIAPVQPLKPGCYA